MTGAPGGGNCLHAPLREGPDIYQGPGTNGYATRHNPASWFASVLDHGGSEDSCRAHSVDLTALWKDASSPKTLPAWSFIEPDTCHDGHDTSALGGCAPDPEGPATRPVSRRSKPGFPAWCSASPPRPRGTATLLISPLLKATGGTTAWQGDHYGLLRTLEASWGLPTLKSKAVSADAAKNVHAGDPGVQPLTGVWK